MSAYEILDSWSFALRAVTDHTRRGGRGDRRKPTAKPTARQVALARAVVAWYLAHYHGTQRDVGTRLMFTNPAMVGHFAVSRGELRAGEPRALFRLLVAISLFQKRQDQQILRVLRSLSAADVDDLTDADTLLRWSATSACRHLSSTDALRERCDLTKHPVTKRGMCGAGTTIECHLKRHTEKLKRYGHFGKVPTSAALAVREAGARDLATLYATVCELNPDAMERAELLEQALMRAWRISRKIAAMYLSLVANPDLDRVTAPWTALDWTRFVVIDSNTDLFLSAISYRGAWTYDARLAFIQRLAREIDLSALAPAMHPYNPRIVQQAAYAFMGASNRRANPDDCMHGGSCEGCELVRRCPCRTR